MCANCWAVYRATHPQPATLYCHHLGTLARFTKSRGWKTISDVDKESVRALRAEGLL